VHVGLLAAIFVASTWQGCFVRSAPLIVPIEFMVEMPGDPAAEMMAPDLPDTVKEPPKPVVKDTVKVPDKKPDKKPVPPKPKGNKKKPSHNLTEEQIRELLAQGAVIGDHTSIPDEDSRNRELIRRTLYGAWTEPSAAEAGDSWVDVEIEFDGEGRIVGSRMLKGSGLTVMDESVMQAVRSVPVISGLTSGFLSRYRKVTIKFEIRE